MPGGMFSGRPHIEDHQVIAIIQSPGQLLAGHRFQLVPVAPIGGGEVLDLSELAGGHDPQGLPQLEDFRGGEPVEDRGALAAASDQAGLPKDLQVLARVSHRQADLCG
jgi:hypothetical protein